MEVEKMGGRLLKSIISRRRERSRGVGVSRGGAGSGTAGGKGQVRRKDNMKEEEKEEPIIRSGRRR